MMKCPQCEEKGQGSKVFPGTATRTDMAFQPFYDEEGAYHRHDRNIMGQDFRCSNGHAWHTSRYDPCPTCGDDWQ